MIGERVTLMVLGDGARKDDCGRISACLTVPAIDGWRAAHCPASCDSYAPPAAWQRIVAHLDGLGASPLAAAEEVDDEEEEEKPKQTRAPSARIVAALADGARRVSEIAAAVGSEEGVGRHRFRRVGALLSQLQRSGVVRRVERGVWGLS